MGWKGGGGGDAGEGMSGGGGVAGMSGGHPPFRTSLGGGGGVAALQKREAVLDKKIAAEVAAAREATVKGNKPVALSHLKKKKQLEENLLKVKARPAGRSPPVGGGRSGPGAGGEGSC